MAERRLDQFNAQNLANTAWALATVVGQQHEQLFKASAKMAERRLDEFNAQNLANTAWAFATIERSGDSDALVLFVTLARMAEQRAGEFSTKNLANISWAFTTAGSSDGFLCKALLLVAERQINDLSMQGLANTV